MDFGLSEQQQKWYDAAVRFGREELVDPESVAREQRGEFWREGYERCGRFGILGLPVPSEYGGQGTDIPTAVAAMEGLGLRLPRHRPDLRPQRLALDDHDADPRVRHRGAEGTLPAPPVRRPQLRCQRGQRARSRLRHLQHDHARRASGRPLGLERPQGLDHGRTDRRRLPLLRHHRSRPRGCWESRPF